MKDKFSELKRLRKKFSNRYIPEKLKKGDGSEGKHGTWTLKESVLLKMIAMNKDDLFADLREQRLKQAKMIESFYFSQAD
ncbi:uncharacterized protein MONOS_18666 [Monocercomonoides exilis]|uniref:uncharacterized protein n=1 Tax=Monocercomonoides exilis TaxID=2049356 RepID=UPI0035595689|nr:hypothetical protein MONOS_18666 [Monocercomonoides exilis]